MSTILSLVSELERLANAISADEGGVSQISLSSVAEKIAKIIGVRNDEVAILAVSTRWKHLHFLVPEALKKVGFIPLSSNSALAAKTARDSRPEIDNNFTAARHATVFEGVKITGEAAESIQKLLALRSFWMARSLGSFRSAAKAQLLSKQALTLPRTTSEKLWRFANHSGNSSNALRASNLPSRAVI